MRQLVNAALLPASTGLKKVPGRGEPAGHNSLDDDAYDTGPACIAFWTTAS